MKMVYRYPLRPDGVSGESRPLEIMAPSGAKPLSVGLRGKEPSLWCEVDTEQPLAPLTLYSVGTGCGVIPPNGRFIGTIIERPYVWHLYW